MYRHSHADVYIVYVDSSSCVPCTYVSRDAHTQKTVPSPPSTWQLHAVTVTIWAANSCSESDPDIGVGRLTCDSGSATLGFWVALQVSERHFGELACSAPGGRTDEQRVEENSGL